MEGKSASEEQVLGAVGFLGLDFDAVSLDQALAEVARLSQMDNFTYVVTPNVDHMVQLYRDRGDQDGASPPTNQLWQVYRDAVLRLCDSRVLARLARASGLSLPVVAGSDLTAALLASPVIAGWRIAVIGGDPSQLDWLQRAAPHSQWLQHFPPMGVRKNRQAQDAIVDFIANAQANLVLFAIGAPQSELVAWRAAQAGNCRGVGLCIGASIEFLTGEKRRAPAIWQKLGIEWAYRLLSEPHRLWRRYLVEGPRIFSIWWQWTRQR